MKTEEQAKLCWCPFTKNRASGVAGLLASESCCIASECMAWRWNDFDITEGKYSADGIQSETTSSIGWCGLAGKP